MRSGKNSRTIESEIKELLMGVDHASAEGRKYGSFLTKAMEKDWIGALSNLSGNEDVRRIERRMLHEMGTSAKELLDLSKREYTNGNKVPLAKFLQSSEIGTLIYLQDEFFHKDIIYEILSYFELYELVRLILSIPNETQIVQYEPIGSTTELLWWGKQQNIVHAAQNLLKERFKQFENKRIFEKSGMIIGGERKLAPGEDAKRMKLALDEILKNGDNSIALEWVLNFEALREKGISVYLLEESCRPNGKIEIVRALLRRGDDPSINYNSPIYIATEHNRYDVLNLLLHDKRVAIFDDYNNAIKTSVESKSKESLALLLVNYYNHRKKPNDGKDFYEILRQAAKNLDLESVALILQRRDPSWDISGLISLIPLNKNYELLRMILSDGRGVSIPFENYWVLREACKFLDGKMLQILIQYSEWVRITIPMRTLRELSTIVNEVPESQSEGKNMEKKQILQYLEYYARTVHNSEL